MNTVGAIVEDGQSILELRWRETLGFYAVVAEDGVRSLCDWLEERGIAFVIERGKAEFSCSEEECALVFGYQNPNWVKDALKTDGYDVALGEGVQCPETEYPPEVERLLRLGDPREKDFDYERMGFAREHASALIHMAVDDELHDDVTDDPRVWAPVHAWRVLGLLKAPEAVRPLIGLLWRIGECDDDWVGEEIPDVLAEIGEPALGPLFACFDALSGDELARNAVSDAVGLIGRRHPECRDACVEGLTERLLRFNSQGSGVNAFLVLALVEMKAVESLAVIEAAFASGRVDPTVLGDVEDVRIEFGVQAERTTPPPRTRLSDLYEAHRETLEEIAPGAGEIVDDLEYDEPLEPYTAPEKVGRNDPCPCGSGKKFKKCCGRGT